MSHLHHPLLMVTLRDRRPAPPARHSPPAGPSSHALPAEPDAHARLPLPTAMALLDATNTQDNAPAPRTLPPSPDSVVDSLRDLASPAYLNHDASLVHVRAGALFARLKALNRAANAATRTHKQATADMRHDMDQTYLSLQNLLYEKRHLEREIEKCRQFASVFFVRASAVVSEKASARYTRTYLSTRRKNSSRKHPRHFARRRRCPMSTFSC